MSINISWDSYLNVIRSLGDMLEHGIGIDLSKIDGIHGIPRGGLIPTTILSHRFDIPLVYNLKDTSNLNVLIVDDISDSGATFTEFKKITEFYNNHKLTFASLYYRYSTTFVPDFSVIRIEHDEWLNFPYEVPKIST
mgnify:CR=1 FL=1